MIHEQWEKLAKNVAHHEYQAQHCNGEEHVNQQLAANKAVDQFHIAAASQDGIAAAEYRLAQIGWGAHAPRVLVSAPSSIPYRCFIRINLSLANRAVSR
jgi:hypothetical protein